MINNGIGSKMYEAVTTTEYLSLIQKFNTVSQPICRKIGRLGALWV